MAFALLMASVLPSCIHTETGWRSVFEPKLTKRKGEITVTKPDGNTRPGKVIYYVSESRSGLSQASAVILDCFNCISGDRAEMHVLASRFPGAEHERLDDVRSGRKVYHCFKVTSPARAAFVFWIDATDYHGLF